jgi:hypothetical protein
MPKGSSTWTKLSVKIYAFFLAAKYPWLLSSCLSSLSAYKEAHVWEQTWTCHDRCETLLHLAKRAPFCLILNMALPDLWKPESPIAPICACTHTVLSVIKPRLHFCIVLCSQESLMCNKQTRNLNQTNHQQSCVMHQSSCKSGFQMTKKGMFSCSINKRMDCGCNHNHFHLSDIADVSECIDYLIESRHRLYEEIFQQNPAPL